MSGALRSTSSPAGLGWPDGIERTRKIVGKRPAVPVIVIAVSGSIESANSAMRAGAYDLVVDGHKSLTGETLGSDRCTLCRKPERCGLPG